MELHRRLMALRERNVLQQVLDKPSPAQHLRGVPGGVPLRPRGCWTLLGCPKEPPPLSQGALFP